MKSLYQPWLDWLDNQFQLMVDSTIALAEINSGSFNPDGVNRVGAWLRDYCDQQFSAQIDTLPVDDFVQINAQGEPCRRKLGDALRICCRPQAPLQLLLVAHLDTVFAIDSPFQQVRWLDSHTLNGPGVCDLKGGMLVMLCSLQALERSPWSKRLGWQILFNPDEEIGSPGSAPLLQQAAQQADLGLVFEPCLPSGDFAGQRKGSGNFTLIVKGRSAHAGREHHLGRNAIRACCDLIQQLDDLNGQRPGLTINPGFIQGGGSVNSVPDRCIGRFNIRLEQDQDRLWFEQQLQQRIQQANQKDGIEVSLHGRFGRLPKRLTPTEHKLYRWVQSCGSELSMQLDWQATGGCCDGNNLSAAGLPNIDTLGVQGGEIHSDREFLLTPSLLERSRLCTRLLLQLAEAPPEWLQPRAST